MDIKLYITFIFNIIHIINSINDQPQHITDYILSFNTYHFEWNKEYFDPPKTLSNNNNNNNITRACTINIATLCIDYTPNRSGFIVSFNNSKYDFTKNNDWTQINYIHANDSITLYDNTYNSKSIIIMIILLIIKVTMLKIMTTLKNMKIMTMMMMTIRINLNHQTQLLQDVDY